jgi:uncharacterized protein (DUF58 family)
MANGIKLNLTGRIGPGNWCNESTLRRAGLLSVWRFFDTHFTVVGRLYLAVSFAWLLSGINSLDLQAYVPVLYSMALWFLAGCALLWVRPRVVLTATHSGRVSAGELLPVSFAVRGAAARADAYRVVPWQSAAGINAEPAAGITLPLLLSQAPATRQFEGALRCARRGVYALPGWRIETDFPFGLLRAGQTFALPSSVTVYPRFTPLQQLEIAQGRRFQPGAVTAVAVQGGDSFELLGNREYREGDSLRTIDWRATARLQRPIVREYREEYFMRAAVVVDTHLPVGSSAVQHDVFEAAISLAAAVGDYLARGEGIVDLLAVGPHLYHLTAACGLACLDQMLDVLACVEGLPQPSLPDLLPELHACIENVNAIICIFLDWDEGQRDFVAQLAGCGAALKIIVVREAPCSLDPAVEAQQNCRVQVISPADVAGAGLCL